MGLFNKISSAIQEGKAKAEHETAEFAKKIEYADLREACRLTVRKLNNASLPMKGSISRLIKKRIENENNDNELYIAFEDMYELSRRKHDIFALNISQWIGAKLYSNNDPRVIAKNTDEKTVYVPSNYR